MIARLLALFKPRHDHRDCDFCSRRVEPTTVRVIPKGRA